jgi:hypothetical protein
MSTTPETNDESNLSPTKCFACGAEFPVAKLKHASISPLLFLGAATDFEPGDAEPPPLFVDRNWYCQPCRSRVNLRRAVLGILFLLVLLTVASVGATLFRQ